MDILVAEDSTIYRHLIAAHLAEWEFRPIFAESGDQAWKVLEGRESPRLALIDWVLPGIDGIELCRRIRRRDSNDYVYTILLTSKSEKRDMLEGMNAGADHFLAKPFDAAELRANLVVGKRLVDLQSELIAAKESLRFAATHDSLTNIWNRAEIFTFLDRELARGRREKLPVAVGLVDLDHFKRINDTLGHAAGDAVLKDVTRRLRAGLRVYDGIGRYGGEEFLVVVPGCPMDAAMTRFDELREAIASKVIVTPQGRTSVTASIGVAVLEVYGENDVHAILQQADAALYRAKEAGRNRVEGSQTGKEIRKKTHARKSG